MCSRSSDGTGLVRMAHALSCLQNSLESHPTLPEPAEIKTASEWLPHLTYPFGINH